MSALPDPKSILNVCVFGAGSFGTAMGFVAAMNGHRVSLLARSEQHANEINTTRRNDKYLKDCKLPDNMTAYSDAATALKDVDLIIHAIPVQATASFLEGVASLVSNSVPIISTSKGILASTCELMCGIFPRYMTNPVLYLSGPSFAKELMRQVPTSVALAAAPTDAAALEFGADALRQRNFRVYTHNDVVGLELAGACKNVVALVAGFIAGAEFGANTQAGVITRAFGEVVRLGEVMGAHLQTFLGLAGLGDLLLTCSSSQSRNYTVGLRLGKGETLAEILASSTQVAEGIASAPPIRKLIESKGLTKDAMPILCSVASVIKGRITPTAAVEYLLMRPAGAENVRPLDVHYGHQTHGPGGGGGLGSSYETISTGGSMYSASVMGQSPLALQGGTAPPQVVVTPGTRAPPAAAHGADAPHEGMQPSPAGHAASFSLGFNSLSAVAGLCSGGSMSHEAALALVAAASAAAAARPDSPEPSETEIAA